MENNLGFFKELLEKKGYKFTKGKAIVLQTISESKSHLNVKEIYERMEDKNIGLSTVYRALRVFTDLSIVKEINVNETNYYEMKIFRGDPLHIHFKCSRCNKIMDIESRELNFEYLKLNSNIERENQIEIYDTNTILLGICKECLEKLKLE